MYGSLLGALSTVTAGTNITYRDVMLEIIEYINTRDFDAALDLLTTRADDAWSQDELVDAAIWRTRLWEMKQDIKSSYDHAVSALGRFPSNGRLLLRIAEIEWKRSRDRVLAEEHVRAALIVFAGRGEEVRSAKRLLARIAFSSGDFRAATQHMLESVPPSNRDAQLGPPLFLQEAVQLAQRGETDALEYLRRLRSLHAEDPEAAREIEDALMRAMRTSS